MKKSDLRTGMVVEYDDGEKRVVLLNTEYGDILKEVATGTMYRKLDQITNDLTFHHGSIDKVWAPMNEATPFPVPTTYEYLIWERKPKKKIITIEVSDELKDLFKQIIEEE